MDGRTLLWEDSETLAFYDPGRPFQVSEIQVLQGGRAGLADVPAARGAPLRYCYLKASISDLAFQPCEEGRCVFKQLAPLLEVPEEDLIEVAQERWDRRYGPS